MDTTQKHIGNRIAEIRQQKGVTQAQLRDQTGINVWRLEEGRVAPTSDTVIKIAEALGVKPFEFFV